MTASTNKAIAHPFDAPYALIDTFDDWRAFDTVAALAAAVHALRAGRKLDLGAGELVDADRARPSVALTVRAPDGSAAERRSAVLAEPNAVEALMAALKATRARVAA